jgi:hypothetical protein
MLPIGREKEEGGKGEEVIGAKSETEFSIRKEN